MELETFSLQNAFLHVHVRRQQGREQEYVRASAASSAVCRLSAFLREWRVGVFGCICPHWTQEKPPWVLLQICLCPVPHGTDFFQRRNKKMTFWKKAQGWGTACGNAEFLLQSQAFCWTRDVNKNKSQNLKQWIYKGRRMRNWRASLLPSSSAQCCSWSQFWMQVVVVHSQVGYGTAICPEHSEDYPPFYAETSPAVCTPDKGDPWFNAGLDLALQENWPDMALKSHWFAMQVMCSVVGYASGKCTCYLESKATAQH